MKQIKLSHILSNNNGEMSMASPQNCPLDRGAWVSERPMIVVTREGDHVRLETNQSTYILEKHPNQNYWWGTCADVKVHVVLKPMMGKVIYF